MVTLSGAHGALAATRAAESLRTTEELRGLRAATHGLRMQVRLRTCGYTCMRTRLLTVDVTRL